MLIIYAYAYIISLILCNDVLDDGAGNASITERREQGTVTTFIAILGILGVLSGCGGRETAAAPEAPQAAETVTAAAPVTEEPVITPDEGTLAKYLVGIRDRKVLK